MTVYFVEAVGADLVRIGHARSAASRLEALRLCSPVELRLLKEIDGGLREETELRERFAEHLVHDAWFRLAPLRDFIESAPADYFRKERETALSRWLKDNGTTPYRFALDNGIDPSAIRKILLHHRSVSPETALKIEKGTQGAVPARLFFKEEK